MSGASRKASPGSSDGEVTSWSVRWSVPAPLVRVSSGSTRVSENHAQVVGMADEHGRAGGGAQHPGGGDLLADQAVHDRRLARPGGAADDGEQRGVEAAQAGEDVVVELADELGPRLAGPLGAGDVELGSGPRRRPRAGRRGRRRGRHRGRRPVPAAGAGRRSRASGGPAASSTSGGTGRVPRRDGLGRASRGHRASSRGAVGAYRTSARQERGSRQARGRLRATLATPMRGALRADSHIGRTRIHMWDGARDW